MKKVNVVSAAIALLFSVSAMAIEPKPVTNATEAKVTTEIGDMLKDNNISLEGDEEIQASVRFTLNEDNEIVVLSVRTEDARIEAFVKAKLNYQEVSASGLAFGKTYEVPVRFTS